jgi:hypothetical protein
MGAPHEFDGSQIVKLHRAGALMPDGSLAVSLVAVIGVLSCFAHRRRLGRPCSTAGEAR